MKYALLCPNHSQCLAANSVAAIGHLFGGQDTPLYYIETERMRQAISGLGGAYGSAELLLLQYAQQQLIRLSTFTTTCIALPKAWVRVNQVEQAKHFYRYAKGRLLTGYAKYSTRVVCKQINACSDRIIKKQKA